MQKLMRVLMVCTLVLSVAGAAAAQGKKAGKKAVPEKGEPKMSPEEAKMMQAMMKAGAPGKEHKALKGMVGSWDAAVTMWMPGKPPMKSTGKSEYKMILGDRFLAEEFTGNMMGKPFTGMGLIGYDNLKKKYVMTWVDDMSTAVMFMEGKADKTGKVVTFEGEALDPMTGTPKKGRMVSKPGGPKKHTVTMFDLPEGGKPVKKMEIVYTKK